MKTFLIMVLSTVLAIGAFLSRPTEENFQAFLRQKLNGAAVPAAMSEGAAESMTQGCSYHDRWLWSTIEMNGKTLYAGLFSRWFAVPEMSGSHNSSPAPQPAGISAF